jgi:hypothetical protein
MGSGSRMTIFNSRPLRNRICCTFDSRAPPIAWEINFSSLLSETFCRNSSIEESLRFCIHPDRQTKHSHWPPSANNHHAGVSQPSKVTCSRVYKNVTPGRSASTSLLLKVAQTLLKQPLRVLACIHRGTLYIFKTLMAGRSTIMSRGSLCCKPRPNNHI